MLLYCIFFVFGVIIDGLFVFVVALEYMIKVLVLANEEHP